MNSIILACLIYMNILSVSLACFSDPNTYCDFDESINANTSILETKIVGGTVANQNQYPWIVFIYDNKSLCGASIINEQWLLTAAHCTAMNLPTMYAYYGTNDLVVKDNTNKAKIAKFINVSIDLDNNRSVNQEILCVIENIF